MGMKNAQARAIEAGIPKDPSLLRWAVAQASEAVLRPLAPPALRAVLERAVPAEPHPMKR